MARSYIRQVGGRTLGYVEEDGSGNKIVYSQAGVILGKYNKSTDTTYDFYGRILTFGDTASGLLLIKNHITI